MCLQEHGHEGIEHDCYTSHRCSSLCTFCDEDKIEGEIPLCHLAAGHNGRHYCSHKDHICGESCHLSDLRNCMLKCTMIPGHDGDHICQTSRHLCGLKCSLPSCANFCQLGYDVIHDQHKCEEIMCPENCCMPSCTRKCNHDHFHGINDSTNSSSVNHICKDTHPCTELCGEEGICRIDSQLLRVKKKFQGKLSEFEYDHQVEQNGNRDVCCMIIPAGSTTHIGKHVHTENQNALHYCESQCHTCGYYCNKEFGHQDLHECKHGNMIANESQFIASQAEFNVGTRKYCRGESSKAEMCDMFCRTLGRGHIHVQSCKCAERSSLSSFQYIGISSLNQPYSQLCSTSRVHVINSSESYGVDLPLDEISHDEYWKDVGWVDPCTGEEQASFRKCNARCGIKTHTNNDDDEYDETMHYCTLDIFHEPVTQSTRTAAMGKGFLSKNGHLFMCSLIPPAGAAYHVIFVIDMSGSMGSADARPADTRITPANRVGCALEACDRFIGLRLSAGATDIASIVFFSNDAEVVFHQQPITTNLIIDHVRSGYQYSYGGTIFSSGLHAAAALADHSPVGTPALIMFLTDGHNNESDRVNVTNIVDRLVEKPEISLRTIGFGSNCGANTLRRIASGFGSERGKFINAVDEVDLVDSFEAEASELATKVSVLRRNH